MIVRRKKDEGQGLASDTHSQSYEDGVQWITSWVFSLDHQPHTGSMSGLLQSVCPQSSAQHMWSKQIN